LKIDRKEIAVIVVFLFAIVTVNAYMRGKWLARQRHQMLEKERAAQLHDGGPPDAAPE